MKDIDLKEIENEMNSPTFWNDKGNADKVLKEYRELKSGSSDDEYKLTVVLGCFLQSIALFHLNLR